MANALRNKTDKPSPLHASRMLKFGLKRQVDSFFSVFSEDSIQQAIQQINSARNTVNARPAGGTHDVPESWKRIGAVALLLISGGDWQLEIHKISAIADVPLSEWPAFEASGYAQIVRRMVEFNIQKRLAMELPAILEGLKKKAISGNSAAAELLLRYMGKLKDTATGGGTVVNWISNYQINVQSPEKPSIPKPIVQSDSTDLSVSG